MSWWLQMEAASDELMMAVELAEDISLENLQQELDMKEQGLQQQVAELQRLQVGRVTMTALSSNQATDFASLGPDRDRQTIQAYSENFYTNISCFARR